MIDIVAVSGGMETVLNDLDVYYRALRNYRILTLENRECSGFRKAIAQADPEKDRVVITRNICFVDEDWIEKIEKGLIFVEKAIKEERQFIYSNGEVIEIEKVKHISKDSVQHLAKHSNLITREQKGDDIIPDKLYSVERLNDYAVYENRFLYMLLCYLKDFITLRYNKILDLTNKYDGVLKIDKEITLPRQRLLLSVDLHEERKDDRYLREHNSAKAVIDRIDLILKTVLAFLATPLMEITGKAPMLKPPITKTNVLKMDNNFKGAVALYDYIIAYDKAGYTVEQKVTELAPFDDVLADEVSEVGALLSFLTYSYGLELNGLLKQRFDTDEAKRKALEIEKKQEKLALLKKRLASSEESVEEYILALEQQNKQILNDNRQILPLKEQVSQLKDTVQGLERDLDQSRCETEEARRMLAEAEERHRAELEALKAEYEDRMHDMLVKHEEDMKALERSCNERIEQIKSEMRALSDQLKEELRIAKNDLVESEARYSELLGKFDALMEEKTVCEARIVALRAERGEDMGQDTYTDKEGFDTLEREYAAFTRFYQSKWGDTKKKIRKKLLNFETLKGNDGQK